MLKRAMIKNKILILNSNIREIIIIRKLLKKSNIFSKIKFAIISLSVKVI